MNSKESSVRLWKLMAFDNISRHPKLPGRMDLLSAMAESGKRLHEKPIKDVGARGFVEMRRLASRVNWAKTHTLTRLDIRQPNGSSVEDTHCHGHFWMRSKAANWHRWSCQITRLNSVDECHGCGLQDVPSKPWTRV